MSLKIYNTEAEVPTELKAFYAANASGKWEPQIEGVNSITGLIAKRDELLGKVSGHAAELGAKDAEIDRLTGDLSNARSSSLPRGKRAVDIADAELADAVKAEGVTSAEAFRALKTEHGEYKTKAETADRRAYLDDVRKKLGWGEDAVDVLELIPGLPDIEDRDAQVNGETKKVPHAKLKEGDAYTYKPFAEYFAEKHKALLRSVTATSQTPDGTELPEHGAGGGGGGKDPVDSYLSTTYSAPKPRQAAA